MTVSQYKFRVSEISFEKICTPTISCDFRSSESRAFNICLTRMKHLQLHFLLYLEICN